MMRENFLYLIKDLSKDENLAISYFFYKICIDVANFSCYNEAPILYNALVSALGFEEHSSKVIAAVNQKHVKAGLLTPDVNADPQKNPFSIFYDIEICYKEDTAIRHRCVGWPIATPEGIDLVRAVFADRKEDFAKIIAYTFFYKQDNTKTTFTIPEKIAVPARIIALAKRTDKVRFLIDSFKLTEEEGLIVNIAYLYHTIKEFYEFCKRFSRPGDENRIELYGKCIGMTFRAIKAELRRDKKLISFGIMDSDGDIDSDVQDCIYTGDLNIFFCDVLKKDEKAESYALDSFSIKKDESELALRLLKNSTNANILLYGVPGSGKTEYARALVKKAGLVPYIFKNELEVSDRGGNPEKHALGRLNCLLSLEKKDSVIIVDEAESLLSTRINFFEMFMGSDSASGKKGTVNMMFENSMNKVVWILNYTSQLDESTLRRFTYSIRFKEMSKTMLRTIADAKLNKLSMSENLHAKLVELCGKYRVTGASVDNVVKTVQGMDLSSGNEERVVSDVQKVLESNSVLLFGKKKMRDSVAAGYDLSVLNTSIPASDIVDMVINAQSFAEKNDSGKNGIRMLFYGLSGTGKTELARYIAEKLNKKILLKRASDILGPYVGQSEQNIAEAFAEAEAGSDILLFDEADSFFSDRQDAAHSWERTLVNEFLTQMEEFGGILICTTNIRRIMDPAMQRRFHILTEFKPLKKEGIEKLLARFFPSYRFDTAHTERLLRYDTVTPGDFGSLSGKIRFMPSSGISSKLIVDELCKIQEEKENGDTGRIGFAI